MLIYGIGFDYNAPIKQLKYIINMKKFILLSLIALFAIDLGFSQENRNIFVGGGFRYHASKTENIYVNQTSGNLQIKPVIGKMISDKFAIGLACDFYSIKNSNKSLTITPFIRYHNNITENLNYYIEPYFMKYFSLKDNSDHSEHKTQVYGTGINAGLLYFISSKISLDLNVAHLYYRHTKDKDDSVNNKSFGIEYDLGSPQIGLKYYF